MRYRLVVEIEVDAPDMQTASHVATNVLWQKKNEDAKPDYNSGGPRQVLVNFEVVEVKRL